MTKSRTIRTVALAVGLLAATAGLAAAAAPEVASVGVTADGIVWNAQVAHERLVLTVSMPGGAVDRQEYRAGEQPSFSVFDRAGQVRQDGVYKWELVAAPVLSAANREALAAARRAGDDAAAVERLRAEGGLPAAIPVQSGAFRIAAGEIVSAGREEGGAGDLSPVTAPALTPVTAADQVIPDDLIVQGSACVGLDCVNNENFGFDTIRLKENNLRIHFDDTSTQAGFPANDWRLIANDSASGGISQFSIEDSTGARTPFLVEAGATTNSIRVDSTGRVGFRTANPVLDLHINTSNTPAIRLEQNSSGGFTAQTWDVAGNEANFFVRDVTGGSRLSFRIRPGAPTGSIDISSDGDVGIGTGSPSAPIHILRDGASQNASFLLENTAGTVPGVWFFQNQSTNGAFVVTPNTGGTSAPLKIFPGAPENSITIGQNGGGTATRVGIHAITGLAHPLTVGTNNTNGNGAHVTAAGVWTNGSSRTYKDNIVDLAEGDALEALNALQPVRYTGKDDQGGEEYVGFIAEDVPGLVATMDRKGVSPMDIAAVLTTVVQIQQRDNQALAARLAELEALVEKLQGAEAGH
jgi:hypothetical protein